MPPKAWESLSEFSPIGGACGAEPPIFCWGAVSIVASITPLLTSFRHIRCKRGHEKTTGQAFRMTMTGSTPLSRRTLLRVFAATAVTAAPTYSRAFGFLKGAGDIRRVKLHSPRTGESVDTIYWIDGKYIPEVLKDMNHFMRDWRSDEVRSMDPRNLDIIAATHRLLDVNEPYSLLSGYRTPATNALLREHSRGVARNSLHIKGMAADLRLGSRTVSQVRAAAEACAAGGVGHYNRSNFVHMDCGPVRTWAG
jgi:uncharacterized protein YcbK (DUF882 family)